jgi:hypothetical protein
VRKATGGSWDPNEGPVYFFAASPGPLQRAAVQPYILIAVNEMMEEGEDGQVEVLLRELIGKGNKVFIDSGVFWLTNRHKRAHDMSMNEALSLHPNDIDGFDTLFSRYVQVCRRYGDQVWGYIELDQGGVARKRETRARLEDLGLRPIPVYHPLNDGPDYLDELMESYDRICFGNIVQANRHVRQRLLHVMWEAKVRHPDVWVHVLGLTPGELSVAFPSNSADSSSWLTGVRWHASERERCMLRGMSGYPRDHAYILGNKDSHLNAYDHAVASYGAIRHTWAAILDERAELGAGPYDMGLLAPEETT